MKINKIALIGMGAIGSYIASTLQSTYKDNLLIIAGGSRGEKLKKEGLIVNGKQMYFNIVDPSEKNITADLIIIITKMGGLEKACEDIKNFIGPETLIMCPLNGVESEDVVGKILGYDNLLYSLTRASSVKDGNSVSFNPDNSFLEFGEKKMPQVTERVAAVKEALERGNVKCLLRDDMEKAIWEKFVCNVGENQISAVLGLNFGAWGKSENANYLRVKTGGEVIAVARAKGIMIDEDYCKNHLEKLCKMPPQNKASTLQDIEHGRKTEVEMFAGTMIRMGKETNVPTPFNDFLYHAIKTLEEKNDGIICTEKGLI